MQYNLIQQKLLLCRKAFWGAFWISFLVNVLMLAIPLYSLQVLDRVLSSGSYETLAMLSVVAVVCIIFIGVFQGIRSLVFLHISRWLDDELSSDVLDCALEQGLNTPQHGNQPLRDLSVLKSFITCPALTTLFDAPWAVIYLLVIFMVHPILGVITIAGALLLLFMAYLNERLTAKKLRNVNEAQLGTMRSADSFIRNTEVINAMGMKQAVIEHWQQFNRPWQHAEYEANNTLSEMTAMTRSIRMALQVCLTGTGAIFVLINQMSAGGIIAVSILAGKTLMPFEQAIVVFKSLINMKQAYNRLAENTEESADKKRYLMDLPEPKGAVSLEKLAYQLQSDSRWLIKGVNIHIEPGELVGIVGPSGSGKTTLARLVVGVLIPTIGCVRIDGADLRHWPISQRADAIGYLPQDVELFSGSVRDNISHMEKEVDDERVLEACQFSYVHDVVLKLPHGYQTDVGFQGAALSAGQRQRIALARAFYKRPKVVMLDEPNSNLDSAGEQALAKCLLNAKAQKITCIVTVHKPSILQIMDKILIMQDGEAKAFGAAKDILSELGVGSGPTETRRAIRIKRG